MSDATRLLALQDADFKLIQLHKRMEELPHRKQILAARNKIKELEAKAKKVEQMRVLAQRALSLLSDEQAIAQRKLDEAQTKLDSTTAYKETASLSAEIDSFARRIAKLEDEELEQMEKLDKVGEVGKQVNDALIKMRDQEQQLTQSFKQQGGALNAAIAQAEALRKEMIQTLPPALVQRYEKAYVAKGGIATAHLDGDHCSACRVVFSDGQILHFKVEVSKQCEASGPEEQTGICECPHCHRLLVVTR